MSMMDLECNFFGRSDVLELLKRRVVDLKEGCRKNVAVLGHRFVGKTTLVQHFLANLDEGEVIGVYLDVENKDFPYFASKFISSLLFNFSQNKNLPLHESISLLLAGTEKLIPNTVEEIRRIQGDMAGHKWSEAYASLLNLPEIFTNETGKFCILVFDEFQHMEDFPVPEVFQMLGQKIMTQKKCFYVVASSFPALAQKVLSEKLALLFGNFETIPVEPFDLKQSQEFIEHSLNGLKIGVQLRNFLTDFTGGHPLFLTVICQELVNLSAIHQQQEIFLPIVAQAVENTIFNRWGVLSRHFELIMQELCQGKNNYVMAEILMALGSGKNKVKDIAEHLGIKKTQLAQRLNYLSEGGIIVKNGSVHYFKDKLFKYWIKYVFQKRLKDIALTPDRPRRQFREEFNRYVENFKVSSRMDFSARIVELLHCFDNEAFDLNGRKYKLPLFRDIEPLRVRNETGYYFDVIKAATADAAWFIVLKKDNFGENDVNRILEEAGKMGRRPERCLIISLTELDENTKLRALQERFWIWNEGELNTLLTLFDKPTIAR